MCMDVKPLLEVAIQASQEASRLILDVYHSEAFETESKKDQSPLTKADRFAHDVITKYLKATQLPILSEEGRDVPHEERKEWDYFWLLDPLDGTKEFISRNGDFTVNIALIHKQRPVIGVVMVPVTGEYYFGGVNLGAFVRRNGKVETLNKKKPITFQQPGLCVVASRSHLNPATEAFIAQLDTPKLLGRGSSLKFMMIADDQADVYPRFGSTMEWDTAASHAILLPLGIDIKDLENRSLQYNKPDLLNPYFVCCAS